MITFKKLQNMPFSEDHLKYGEDVWGVYKVEIQEVHQVTGELYLNIEVILVEAFNSKYVVLRGYEIQDLLKNATLVPAGDQNESP